MITKEHPRAQTGSQYPLCRAFLGGVAPATTGEMHKLGKIIRLRPCTIPTTEAELLPASKLQCR